jgi:hypothetical protein
MLFIAIFAMTIVFGPGLPGPRAGGPSPSSRRSGLRDDRRDADLGVGRPALLLFLGLELMVLPGYMLAGFHKTDSYSTEGAIKYFLLGHSARRSSCSGGLRLGTGGLDADPTSSPDHLGAVVAGNERCRPGWRWVSRS